MSASSQFAITFVISFLTGGALGALIGELFRRRRSKTRFIPLFEVVNRNPLLYELRGAKLVLPVSGSGETIEVTNLWHYQLLLQNTSDIHLRDAQVQFEFMAAEEILSWVSKPSVSKASLAEVTPSPIQAPWTKAYRWKIPQFPPGDSVEFGFQVVNPSSEKFEAFLDSGQNVMLQKKEGPPEERSTLSKISTDWVAAIALSISLATLGSVSSAFFFSQRRQAQPLALAGVWPLSSPHELEQLVEGRGYRAKVSSRVFMAELAWEYSYSVRNIGDRPFTFVWKETNKSSGDILSGPVPPGQDVTRVLLAGSPELTESEIVINNTLQKSKILALRPRSPNEHN